MPGQSGFSLLEIHLTGNLIGDYSISIYSGNDISIGEEVSRLPHSDAVTSVSFSKDGNLLATVSRKVVQFWDIPALPLVPTSDLINVACSHLTANISKSDWEIIFPGEDYRPICPDLQTTSN